jgi:hypothetical protein
MTTLGSRSTGPDPITRGSTLAQISPLHTRSHSHKPFPRSTQSGSFINLTTDGSLSSSDANQNGSEGTSHGGGHTGEAAQGISAPKPNSYPPTQRPYDSATIKGHIPADGRAEKTSHGGVRHGNDVQRR